MVTFGGKVLAKFYHFWRIRTRIWKMFFKLLHQKIGWIESTFMSLSFNLGLIQRWMWMGMSMWNLHWSFYNFSCRSNFCCIIQSSKCHPMHAHIFEVNCHRCMQANSSKKSNSWRRRDELFDLTGQIPWNGLSSMQADANFDSLKNAKPGGRGMICQVKFLERLSPVTSESRCKFWFLKKEQNLMAEGWSDGSNSLKWTFTSAVGWGEGM